MRCFVEDHDQTYFWCVLPEHWEDDDHALGDLSDMLDLVWDGACRLHTVVVKAGTLLCIDDAAINGIHVGDQCVAQESVEKAA